jgi:hypothetical protein
MSHMWMVALQVRWMVALQVMQLRSRSATHGKNQSSMVAHGKPLQMPRTITSSCKAIDTRREEGGRRRDPNGLPRIHCEQESRPPPLPQLPLRL